MTRAWILLSLLFFQLQISSSKSEPTLVISFDAFRYDYILRIRELVEVNGQVSNFWRLIREGSHALNGIGTTFTTLTLPIHTTIATGLYEESHGVVGNVIYDPGLNRSIDLAHAPLTEDRSWVYGGEPIWNTLRKQTPAIGQPGVFGCLQWIGCEAANLTSDHFVPFRNDSLLENLIDQAVQWLQSGTRLVMMYYQQPDTTGHTFGPDSKEMNDTLISLDAKLGYLLQKLETIGMMDKINLIVMADHGMMEVGGAALNNVSLPVDMFDVWSWAQPIWLVEPKPGRLLDTVSYFQKIPNVQVFNRDTAPLRWHYRNNNRIPSLIIIAAPGYTLNNLGALGTHGYDTAYPDMRPSFIAHGPAFISNTYVPEEMSTVDVYLMLCKLLALTPAPNNGTMGHFTDFVKLAYLIGDAGADPVGTQAEQSHGHRSDNENYNAALIVMSVCITITILVLIVLLVYALVQSVRPPTRPTWRERADSAMRNKREYQIVGSSATPDRVHGYSEEHTQRI